MPIFEYEAINANGKKIKSSIDADSVKAARTRLRSQGNYVTVIKESAKNKVGYSKDLKQLLTVKSVSTAKLAQETRQLATLVAAGIPLVDSLQII
jgi:general secretion pathway protein F